MLGSLSDEKLVSLGNETRREDVKNGTAMIGTPEESDSHAPPVVSQLNSPTAQTLARNATISSKVASGSRNV
jgi:hypothetical protein